MVFVSSISIKEAVSIFLQALLVVFLVIGPVRQYFIILVYSVVYLITTVVEAYVRQQMGTPSSLYRWVYWTDEIVLDLLLFLMVIILTLQASRGSPLQAGLRKLLTGVFVIAVTLPFLLNHDYFTNPWFRHASQILTFGGAIMNLALWTALIGSKKRDPQLLMVSAGLGVAVTGQAIFWGFRLLTTSQLATDIARFFNVVTYIAGLAIWCWAFRPAARTARPGPPPQAIQVDA